MKMLWCCPMERTVNAHAVMSLLDVSIHAHHFNIMRINMAYKAVDDARNSACKIFWKNTTDDDDVLVMLDNDHKHPADILERLIQRVDAEHEVVGALAFRRSEPHDPCFYNVAEEGQSANVATSFDGSLVKCDIVGTGAIAIRRSAFRKLQEAGHEWPWFRFVYKDGMQHEIRQSEDWSFGLMCKRAGIPHWCDTSLETPHLGEMTITAQSWISELQEGMKDPDTFERKYELLGMKLPRAEAQS